MRRCIVAIGLLSLILGACAPSSPGDNNTTGYSSDCEASNESGIYLTALGNFDYAMISGGTVTLNAMTVHLDDGSGELGGIASGVEVSFQIISIGGDGVLSADRVYSDANGIARVDFTAASEGAYQITATAEGACEVTFSIEVSDQLRGLRVVGTNPVTTFTNRRINLSVQAYSPDPGFGEYPLVGETITFDLGNGGTGTALEDAGGTLSGAQIQATTNPAGIATVSMVTGTVGVPGGVDVTATLAGTQPVVIHVNIQESGSGPCTTNADCPASAPICDNGTCIQNPTQTGPCTSNADCVSPYVCYQATGDCIAPNTQGQSCNPVQGSPCPAGEICIAGHCTEIPTGNPCADNDDCPTGWLCVNGVCEQVLLPGETPCTQDPDCPSGWICLSGICIDPGQCTPPTDPTRLQGTWQFDSMLHLREALAGWLDAILTASETLRDIIQGNLNIPGIPSWVESFIQSIIQSVINAYVPPWAQQFLITMGNISDVIDDMRVYSTVSLIAQGNYEYVGQSTWDIVEFDYQGQLISENPANIPEIGTVPTQTYTSREICQVFYIDQYEVNNIVGGLIRWAIEAILTGVTCSVPNWPCYFSIEDALEDLIDCDEISYAIGDMVYNTFGLDIEGPVYTACDTLKGPAIQAIIDALDSIEVQLSLMTLRGEADIDDDWNMSDGMWYGTLAGGNYDGEFTAWR